MHASALWKTGVAISVHSPKYQKTVDEAETERVREPQGSKIRLWGKTYCWPKVPSDVIATPQKSSCRSLIVSGLEAQAWRRREMRRTGIHTLPAETAGVGVSALGTTDKHKSACRHTYQRCSSEINEKNPPGGGTQEDNIRRPEENK